MKKSLVIMLSLWVGVGCSNSEKKVEQPARSTVSQDGVAADGFDVVSYFSGSPVKGSPEFSKSWNGSTWHFATQENLNLFEAQPEKYAPQYGGHCALAMSLGELAPGSTKSWHIEDGKLYFHNGTFTRFLFKMMPGRASKADREWSQLPEK